MDEINKKEECIRNINKYMDEINFIRETSIEESELSMETLFRLSYSIGKAWLIYNTIYRVKNSMLVEKHKKLHEDNGVSSVIGTLLMVTITVSLFTTVFFISSQMNTTMLQTSKETSQNIIDMSTANMEMIDRFIEYVNKVSFAFNMTDSNDIHKPTFNPDNNTNNIPPPIINYTFDLLNQCWVLSIVTHNTQRDYILNESGELSYITKPP